jgi:hypothetical protein
LGPIEIKDEPKAQDEYDRYIGKLYDLLVSGAPDTDLVEYLYRAAHYQMGFDAARRSDMFSTVEELRKIEL